MTDRRRSSVAGDLGRDGEPAPIAARPDVRVAAGPRSAVRPGEGGPRVDDRDVAQEANVDVVFLEVGRS